MVRLLELNGVTGVLDIGANVGQFGSELREARFTGDIVSVEPFSDAFCELSKRVNRDPRWVAENAAVSDRPGVERINVAGNSASSSVLPMLDHHAEAAPISRYVTTVDVRATTVDDLVERHCITPGRSMLKIDVQGYGHSVLRAASATLPEFAAIQMELSLVPLYDGQASADLRARTNGCTPSLLRTRNTLSSTSTNPRLDSVESSSAHS